MLAHERVVEAQTVRQNDGLAVLLQRLRWITFQRVERHREVTEFHVRFLE